MFLQQASITVVYELSRSKWRTILKECAKKLEDVKKFETLRLLEAVGMAGRQTNGLYMRSSDFVCVAL